MSKYIFKNFPIPHNYCNNKNTDITFQCTDGKLYFSRFLLREYEYFNFKDNIIQCEFDCSTINYILNNIDKTNGIEILPDNVKEVTLAAFKFGIKSVLEKCRSAIIKKPRLEYYQLAVTVLPDIRRDLLTALLENELLGGMHRDVYISLYNWCLNPIKISRAFVADGYKYDDDIKLELKNLSVDECKKLSRIFNDPRVDSIILKYMFDLSTIQNNKINNAPLSDFKSYYKFMIENSKNFQNRHGNIHEIFPFQHAFRESRSRITRTALSESEYNACLDFYQTYFKK